MIEKHQVMNLLIKACPSFEKSWKQYIAETYEDGEEQLPYIDMIYFIQHLIELYKQNNTEEFRDIFEVVELMHSDGSDYVKEVATIGFFETLQNQLSNNNIDIDEFKSYLIPLSNTWWNHLLDFWNGKMEYVGGPLKE
ncbi:MAG: hypothetical protein P0Y55_08595 [Candidatus Cohnella colombiensis]|uniref:DUF7674 domain-containing protein n=1 Tax=Candidatus Cohnella colombiensis TaxID=3121368 RepID=A0AA95F6U7_9BACL|nr:MAG: hypothetical protein P0Y55_08595 [Cohnella sp.]